MFLDQEKWFSHFKEADIKFKPTYKFSTKTNEFSSSRIPSYCDRILYCQNYAIDSNIESDGIEDKVQIQPLKYDCISELNNSDHKPVYGLFELKVFHKKFSSLVRSLVMTFCLFFRKQTF